MNMQAKEMFLAKVRKTETCWEWRGATNSKGYGRCKIQQRMWLAHRWSWVLHKGAIPVGLLVLHHCDNRRCVNPEHLFLGTARDNTQDMIRKGRGKLGTGHMNVRHWLPDATVLEIREKSRDGASIRQLAREYAMTEGAIRHVLTKRRLWNR